MKKKPTVRVRYSFVIWSFALLFISCTKNSSTPQGTRDTTDTPVPKPTVPSRKWIVSTVAGSNNSGFTDGDTSQVQFYYPKGICTDNHGNLFVGDQVNSSIRQVTYSGHVTTYAGKNIGNASPIFGNIEFLVRDSLGNLYTTEYGLIRKIESPTKNSVLAGSLTHHYIDGTGTNAGFFEITQMTIDHLGNIFLPDYNTSSDFHIRKVTPGGVVSTLILQDNTGISSGSLPNLYYSCAISLDALGNIYVTANGNCLIKKVSPAGDVTILAGAGDIGFVDGKGRAAKFYNILGMTCDASGNLWVSDGANHAIRKVTPDGTVTTIAGKGTMGYADGDSTQALFNYPTGITIDNAGTVFVVDSGNSRVRKLEFK